MLPELPLPSSPPFPCAPLLDCPDALPSAFKLSLPPCSGTSARPKSCEAASESVQEESDERSSSVLWASVAGAAPASSVPSKTWAPAEVLTDQETAKPSDPVSSSSHCARASRRFAASGTASAAAPSSVTTTLTLPSSSVTVAAEGSRPISSPCQERSWSAAWMRASVSAGASSTALSASSTEEPRS